MINVVVFDIDGTVADISQRRHFVSTKPKNWKAFFEGMVDDTVIEEVRFVYNCIVANGEYDVVFSSGRPDNYREQTVKWLYDNNFHVYDKLYMRKAGDYRPDYIVKKEILDNMLSDGYNPIMAFDDRDQVVKMWRDNGIVCMQVAEGSF